MTITFHILGRGQHPSNSQKKMVHLAPGNWDDYNFKTSFEVTFHDMDGKLVNLGTVKIGYAGQIDGWSSEKLPTTFSKLGDGWFSLAQDVSYYESLYRKVGAEDRATILSGLSDVVADDTIFRIAQSERVFHDSLMRSVSLSVIHGQFKRVISGKPALTDFHFKYKDPGDDRHASIELDFEVKATSKPSSNIHVIIGRNGVGKTTLLNNMVNSIVRPASELVRGRFSLGAIYFAPTELHKDYFSSVVSVSFSAFDPFIPPVDRPDRTHGAAYFYIGMKNARDGEDNNENLPPKNDAELAQDFLQSFESCLSQPAKRQRWRAAIERLESDDNFADMDLLQLLELENEAAIKKAKRLIIRMSSGHFIVLLTMTKLVDTVEEKTLVLLDEPESHLHPPLLSAFTRALADLLHNRNGVAIIATHSPVVLQEVPRSCVWKLTRLRTQGRSDRPERETFGENVGILTREIFGLEVTKSGFHEILQREVESGGDFESIFKDYGGQLGVEAQAILRTLIASHQSDKRTTDQ